MLTKKFLTPDRLPLVVGIVINKAGMFIFTIMLARTLGPEIMGTWQTAILVASYASLFTLGVINGMGRDVPFFRGACDMLSVKETISTTFWITAGASILTGLFILTAMMLAEPAKWLVFGGLLLVARAFNAFGRILLRSFQDFRRLGLHEGLSGFLLLAATVTTFANPNLAVAVFGYAFALTILFPFWIHRIALTHFQHRTYFRLLSVGTPIMLAGTLFSLLTAVDRLVILATMSQHDLGLYTPVIAALNLALLGPSIVSTYVYPRLGKEYGRVKKLECLRPFIRRMMHLNTAISVFIAASGLVVLNLIIIPWILPEYSEAKCPVAITLLASIPLGFAMSFGDFFNVIGCHLKYLRNIFLAILINAITGFVLVQYANMGLTGVAIGSFASTLSFAALQYWSYLTIKTRSVI